MPKLILLRHGQSTWNLENRFTGWIDVPLTEQGKKEADEAGKLLKDIKLDIAFTSVLIRAVDTLSIALRAAGQDMLPIVFNKAINERMYGDLQGLNKAETAIKFGDHQVKLWRRSYDVAPPNGESLKDTAARSIPYFQNDILPAVISGSNVLVSAHGNSLRAIVMHLDKMTEAEVLELNIPNGVPIVYEIDSAGNILSKTELMPA
jgi:2,3-bisphosphoglycerate-dependent phosphoglycerate mutase